MINISIATLKAKLSAYVNDFYQDIITDFKRDLQTYVDSTNMEETINIAKSIQAMMDERDKLDIRIGKAQSLYDILEIIKAMCDGNDYPFCEQEEIIFKDVFGINIV